MGMAVILPFLAGAQFYFGKRLEKDYRYKTADIKFNSALRLDPISAEYHSGIGKFYSIRAGILKDNMPALLRAEGEYKKAHELNPYGVRYLMELAAIEAKIFLADKVQYGDRAKNSIGHFKEALEKDPHNYIFSYDTAHNFVSLWNYINDEEKQFVINRFKYFLGLDLGYHWHIYPMLWKKLKDFDVILEVTPAGLKHYERLYNFVEKNELWEYRYDVVNLLDKYREVEEPERFKKERANKLARIKGIKDKYERMKDDSVSAAGSDKFAVLTDWYGTADGGDNAYIKGNMYWNGTVDRLAYLPPAVKNIVITACGSAAGGIYPYMIVELDGEKIGEAFVNSGEWKRYSFKAAGPGLKVISVSFINDGGNIGKGEDRNLYVGDVTVE